MGIFDNILILNEFFRYQGRVEGEVGEVERVTEYGFGLFTAGGTVKWSYIPNEIPFGEHAYQASVCPVTMSRYADTMMQI